MSKKLSLAYIFQQQQLLVDQHFQLPQVEALASDLLLNPGDQVVARDLLPDEPIPEGATGSNPSIITVLECSAI